jgi:hypothetical protein
MAVVQISRIQLRRGRKNTDTGIPQLASGELGWAIDTQELFIGNGAVSEGSPNVGNTKILTENDNILDLALQYQYLVNDTSIQTGPTTSEPVRRSLQERLDEMVSVRSFGAIGDGFTDDTLAIQRALDQLYLNSATKGLVDSRRRLHFPAGRYLISQTLKIPPYATISGAGIDKTIISQTANLKLAETVNELSLAGNYQYFLNTNEFNQPRQVDILDLTLQGKANFMIFDARSLKDSQFTNVKFKGEWEPGDDLAENNCGVQLLSETEQLGTRQTRFNNCYFENLSYGVQSTYDIDQCEFISCFFKNLGMGFYMGYDITASPGKTFGPRRTNIISSVFEDIDREGINFIKGKQNLSSSNKFIRVGNDGGTSNQARYAVVKFNDTGNVSENDYFERSIDLSGSESLFISSPYIGEFAGSIVGSSKFTNETSVIQSTSFIPVLRMAAFANASYRIHYIYYSLVTNIIRKGIIDILVDKINNAAHLTDTYDTNSNLTVAENLRFSASLDDVDLVNGFETVTINYANSTPSDNGIIRYWYEVLS